MRGQTAEDSLCHDDALATPGCAETACEPGAQLTWRYDARTETLTGHLVLRQAQGVAAYPLAKTRPFGAAGPCFCFGGELAELKWVTAQQLTTAYAVQGGGGKMCWALAVTSSWLLDANGQPILVVDSTVEEPLHAAIERRDDVVTITRGSVCSAQVSWAELTAMPPAQAVER
jgi:hypothetical protein